MPLPLNQGVRASEQLLPGIMEEIGISEEAEMPNGIGELSQREINFVLGVLRHGQLTRAAREAGYGKESDDGLYVTASRLLRKPKVLRFYRGCVGKLAKNADKTVERVSERSILLHSKALETAQEVRQLDEMILEKEKNEAGVDDNGAWTKEVREYETRRAAMVKLEKHYMTLANQTDTLLASLLGKLNLNLTGEVHHTEEITVATGTLDALARARRDVTEAGFAGGRN